MGIEKIMHMQEELIKTYKKQISGLEKENASLRKMLDMQNEIDMRNLKILLADELAEIHPLQYA